MIRKFTTILVILSITYTTWFALMFVNPELISANNLANKKIINDHSKNPSSYNLWENVLRQEIAAIARSVAKLEKKDRCDNIFSDISDTKPNTWACINIEALVDNNIISKNSTFRPEEKITKSEAIAMLIKAIWFDYSYNPELTWNWQQQVVSFAVEKWVVEKFTDYDTFATRGWVFWVADTTIKIDEELKQVFNAPKIFSDEVKLK
jgi:hypothetical protein